MHYVSWHNIIKNMFIGQELALNQLIDGIKNGHNLLVFGSPYQGKSMLIHEALSTFPREKTFAITIECKKTFTAKRFLEKVATQVIASFSTTLADLNAISHLYLPQLQPALSVYPGQGLSMNMSYHISEKQIYVFVAQLLKTLATIATDYERKGIIIFDDYDELADIDQGKLIQIIATHLLPSLSYVFVCSNEQIIQQIFSKKTEKLYRINTIIEASTLPLNIIYFYINERFGQQGIKITENFIDRIIALTQGEIHFVRQFIDAALLYAAAQKRLGLIDLVKIQDNILMSHDKLYFFIFNSCSTHQKNLLIAIVKNSGKQIYQSTFIYENTLGSAPSIQTSIAALKKRGIVTKKKQEFILIDPFFRAWIKKHFCS